MAEDESVTDATQSSVRTVPGPEQDDAYQPRHGHQGQALQVWLRTAASDTPLSHRSLPIGPSHTPTTPAPCPARSGLDQPGDGRIIPSEVGLQFATRVDMFPYVNW